MTTPATIKRGDRKPDLTLTVTNAGAPVDLTSASAVRLLIRAKNDRSGGAPYLDVALAGRPANGVLTYAWGASDTATAGSYDVEVEVTWPGSLKQTFPGGAYGALLILADLG